MKNLSTILAVACAALMVACGGVSKKGDSAAADEAKKNSIIEAKAIYFVNRLADYIFDKDSIDILKSQMDTYYATLSAKEKELFNNSMKEYINISYTDYELKKAKTVEEIIEGIKEYRNESISTQQLPAFIAELENLATVLSTEDGKKNAKSENEKINAVIKEFNEDLGTEKDEKRFIEELGKLIEDLKSEGENAAAQEEKDKISGYLNSLVEFFLTDEENAIFKVKLGEYVQGIKAGKPESVKMDGNFVEVVNHYNGLSAEDKALFVEVVEEYIK